jgi:hypothetical protein
VTGDRPENVQSTPNHQGADDVNGKVIPKTESHGSQFHDCVINTFNWTVDTEKARGEDPESDLREIAESAVLACQVTTKCFEWTEGCVLYGRRLP